MQLNSSKYEKITMKMSKYTIREVTESEKDKWDEFVLSVTGSVIFHLYGWLKTAENESGFKLHPVAIEENQKIVAIFPVFYKSVKGISVILSPPAGCAIPYLGPVFHFKTNNQYKIESTYKDLTKIFNDYFYTEFKPDYFRFNTTPQLNDVRPFIWTGYNVKTNYTYYLLLSKSIENIFSEFDSRIRNLIKKFDKTHKNYIVKNIGLTEIVCLVKKRYRLQGIPHNISYEYFEEISKLYPNKISSIGIVDKDVLISGLVLLEHNKHLQFWIGGVSVDKKYNGINEKLHWLTVQEYQKKAFNYYENIGANTEHLCLNKSKYNFKPECYFSIEKKTLKSKIAEYMLKKFGIRGSSL